MPQHAPKTQRKVKHGYVKVVRLYNPPVVDLSNFQPTNSLWGVSARRLLEASWTLLATYNTKEEAQAHANEIDARGYFTEEEEAMMTGAR